MNREKAGTQYLVIESAWKVNDSAKRSLVKGVVVGVYDHYQDAITKMRALADNCGPYDRSNGEGSVFAMVQVLFSRIVKHEIVQTEVDYRQV